MTLNDLSRDGVIIQGGYIIKVWDESANDYNILVEGCDFECDAWNMDESWLDTEICFIYAVDGKLNIEFYPED